MYDVDDEIWLHLLPDDQQHAGLLRLLTAPTDEPMRRGKPRTFFDRFAYLPLDGLSRQNQIGSTRIVSPAG